MAGVGEREPLLQLVTGVKRIGKSNGTIKFLNEIYCRDTSYGPGRKALIYDHNNEYKNYTVHRDDGTTYNVNVPLIGHDDITRFSNQRFVEMRRITPIDKYGRPMSADDQDALIVRAMTEFRGGCLFIEDLNTVFGDSLPKAVSGFFTNNAHRDCDIILHVQSIARVVPKLWQNCNMVRFLRQQDSVLESKEKLGAHFTLFQLEQLIVDFQYNNGNKRYYLYVDKDERKIVGNVTQGMFDKAVIDYLQMYPSVVKRKLGEEHIITGEKLYSREQVITALKENYSREYFGNRIAA